MKTAARCNLFFALPAAALVLSWAGTAAPLQAQDTHPPFKARTFCPLRHASPPEDETPGMFSSSGPYAADFKLKNIRSGRFTSFLETARCDYSFLFFLDTSSREALLSLNTLERLRNRGRGRISLTAVFRDAATEAEVRRYLDHHGLLPDFALHDPVCSTDRCYSFEPASTLHVVGPHGRIIFTASESRPVDLAAFSENLNHLLSRKCGPSAFAEAKGIYGDAVDWLDKGRLQIALIYFERVLELQPQLFTVNRFLADIYYDLERTAPAARHYARYLAAGHAYDTDDIRRKLRSLAEK